MCDLRWSGKVVVAATPDEVVAWMRTLPDHAPTPPPTRRGAGPPPFAGSARFDDAARTLARGTPPGDAMPEPERPFERWTVAAEPQGGARVEVEGGWRLRGFRAVLPGRAARAVDAHLRRHLIDLEQHIGLTAAQPIVHVAW